MLSLSELPIPRTNEVGAREVGVDAAGESRCFGAHIAGYRVIAKIGSGGMGEVYLGIDDDTGATVAIKTLLPRYADNQALVARFFAEAKAAARIEHAGTVKVITHGYCGDQRAYLVMEYLKGESLRDRLARERWVTIDAAVEIARQAALALASVHKCGIIHRDIKPGNIYLCAADADTASGANGDDDGDANGDNNGGANGDNDGGAHGDNDSGDQRRSATAAGERQQVKIFDFGVAKLMDMPLSAEMATPIGLLMGTPAYMSPEQCTRADEVDHRTDLYALGCVLYTMLCGRPPFVGSRIGRVISSHLSSIPLALRVLRPNVPAELERIVLRLLAKQPADRYQSADELAAALSEVSAALPAEACGYSDESRACDRGMAAIRADDETLTLTVTASRDCSMAMRATMPASPLAMSTTETTAA